MFPKNCILTLIAVLLYHFSLLKGQHTVTFEPTWELKTNPSQGQAILKSPLHPDYFYFANKEEGVKIFKESNDNDPIQIKQFAANDFNGAHAMNLFIQNEYLFVALGDFFNNNFKPTGLAIIDISDPELAKISSVRLFEGYKGAPHVEVEGQFAYLSTMEHGILILDVEDKTVIDSLTTYLPDVDFPVPMPTGTIIPNVRFTDRIDNLLYVCFDAGGLRILNVANHNQIQEIGKYINPLHEFTPQAYNSVVIYDSLAYVALDYCGFEILNISDPESISTVAQINPWNCTDQVWLFNEGHANQSQLDIANNLLYLSAGDSEIVCYDVSNPFEPKLAGEIGELTDQVGSWGSYFYEDKLYVTYISTVVPFVSFYAGIKTFEITINPITSTNFKVPKELEVNAYPNPFSENVFIEFGEEIVEDIDYQIYNQIGIKLSSGKIHPTKDSKNVSNINFNSMNDGLYFIYLKSNKKSITLPVIKTHTK